MCCGLVDLQNPLHDVVDKIVFSKLDKPSACNSLKVLFVLKNGRAHEELLESLERRGVVMVPLEQDQDPDQMGPQLFYRYLPFRSKRFHNVVSTRHGLGVCDPLTGVGKRRSQTWKLQARCTPTSCGAVPSNGGTALSNGLGAPWSVGTERPVGVTEHGLDSAPRSGSRRNQQVTGEDRCPNTSFVRHNGSSWLIRM